MSYAKNNQMKLEKRKLIIDEVQNLYETMPFEAIKMNDVAQNVGVSKGTVFNYFESKETLFLVLLIREYGAWFDGLFLTFKEAEVLNRYDLSRIIDRYIDETIVNQPRLFSLIALGHSRLEHNVSLKMATMFRAFINDKVKEVGFEVAKKVTEMTPIKGIKLIMTLHTMLVGHAQLAVLPSIMTDELELDELENYEIDLRMTMLETLKVYMKGLL